MRISADSKIAVNHRFHFLLTPVSAFYLLSYLRILAYTVINPIFESNKRATGIGMSPNMQAFVETILSRLAETEDLTLLHPKSTWQIYEATVKEGKHEPPDYWDPEV